MFERITTKFNSTGSTLCIDYQPVNTCPMCKHAINPTILAYAAYKTNKGNFFCILNRCEACKDAFIAHYLIEDTGTIESYRLYSSRLKYSAPNLFEPTAFEELIENLSPSFVNIYNQASAAESHNLDEIAGLGYRKALEFLIKDFAISENPEDKEKIKSMMLSPCIKNYIDDPRIKTLAEKSAWIGNDEAHYIRKQENRDVSDMKSFITATVYFVSMVLITKDAETISPK